MQDVEKSGCICFYKKLCFFSEIKKYDNSVDSTIPSKPMKRTAPESDPGETPVKAKKQKVEMKQEAGMNNK